MFDKCIKFVVYGEPQSKLRAKARINRKTGSVYMYTPESTRNYEEGFAAQSLKNKPDTLITGAIKIGITICRTPPKSLSKKERELFANGELYPIKRPDLDNYIKICLDAMRGIYFIDDTQIIEFLPGTKKCYDLIPRVEVIVQYDN